MTHRLVLASTSPQRRTILKQLAIPFEAVAPRYVEHDPPDADPVALVRDHALGKARSVHEAGRTTLGVDTTVHLGQRVYAKPRDEDDARAMLRELAGETHAVLSGLCLMTSAGAAVEHAETLVTSARSTTRPSPATRPAGSGRAARAATRSRVSAAGSWSGSTATT